MPDKERIPTRENLPETLDWLEASLHGKAVSQKEIITAQHLVEEIFRQMSYLTKSPRAFSVRIALQSQPGSVSLRMVSEGEALRPFAAFPQDNEDAGRRASMAIFRAHHHLLRISRKRGGEHRHHPGA